MWQNLSTHGKRCLRSIFYVYISSVKLSDYKTNYSYSHSLRVCEFHILSLNLLNANGSCEFCTVVVNYSVPI